MRKRRLQSLNDGNGDDGDDYRGLKKQKIGASSSTTTTTTTTATATMNDLDVSPPMIYFIPTEVLSLICRSIHPKDKIRLMRTSHHLLRIVPQLIKGIDFFRCNPAITTQEAVTRTLQRCTSLQHLVFNSCKLGYHRHQAFSDALLNLTGLKTISLIDVCLPVSILSQLYKLPNLCALHLAGTKTTNKVLRNLQSLKNLVLLDLSRTPLKPRDNWLSLVADCTTLKHLKLNGIEMETANTGLLTSLSGLANLWLNGTKAKLFPMLNSLPNLKYLSYVHKTAQAPTNYVDEKFPPLLCLSIDLDSLPIISSEILSLKWLNVIDYKGRFARLDSYTPILSRFPNLQTLILSPLRDGGVSMVIPLSNLAFHLKSLEVLKLEFLWDTVVVGGFFENYLNILAIIPSFKTLQAFQLRITFDAKHHEDDATPVDVVWQSMVYCLTLRGTTNIFNTIPDCEIVLVLKGGNVFNGNSKRCTRKSTNNNNNNNNYIA